MFDGLKWTMLKMYACHAIRPEKMKHIMYSNSCTNLTLNDKKERTNTYRQRDDDEEAKRTEEMKKFA